MPVPDHPGGRLAVTGRRSVAPSTFEHFARRLHTCLLYDVTSPARDVAADRSSDVTQSRPVDSAASYCTRLARDFRFHFQVWKTPNPGNFTDSRNPGLTFKL